jgi:hypothetical protein
MVRVTYVQSGVAPETGRMPRVADSLPTGTTTASWSRTQAGGDGD